jgi:hypothetical protein
MILGIPIHVRMPYGLQAEIDCEKNTFSILENAVIDQ